jgi:hypothetical protein
LKRLFLHCIEADGVGAATFLDAAMFSFSLEDPADESVSLAAFGAAGDG